MSDDTITVQGHASIGKTEQGLNWQKDSGSKWMTIGPLGLDLPLFDEEFASANTRKSKSPIYRRQGGVWVAVRRYQATARTAKRKAQRRARRIMRMHR